MDEFKADLYQDFKGNETFEWDDTLKNFTEAFSQDQYDDDMLQKCQAARKTAWEPLTQRP